MKLPIVYSPHYNIRLLGVQRFHPFDSEKYGKVKDFLVKHEVITEDGFHEPEAAISEDELKEVHTEEYLKSLRKSRVVAGIAELGFLRIFPNFLLQKKFLNPMRWATAGTLLATRLAFEHGWAINLSGGYHHAKGHHSSGFCFFADINMAAYQALNSQPDLKKVLVVDLDAHQGNGFADVFGPDQRIDTLDLYNGHIYPQDTSAKQHIRYDHPVAPGMQDVDYLAKVRKELPHAIATSKPGFIIYNAGSDIYEKDRLGGFKVSAKGILVRDETVFRMAKEQGIPILMLLSGGYHAHSAGIIGSSIRNLKQKGLLT